MTKLRCLLSEKHYARFYNDKHVRLLNIDLNLI